MKAIRAASLTIALGSFLIWLYCCVRIFLGDFPFSDLFIDGIPITFLEISIGAFIVFLASTFSCLILEEI
jgi:hypothetical protein